MRPAEGLGARVPTGDHRVLQEFDVDVVSIDALLEDRGLTEVDVLKVDAEGYDLEVLKGARKALEAGHISAVLTEVFFVSYREGQKFFWDIASFLDEVGYYFVNLFDTHETGQRSLHGEHPLGLRFRCSHKRLPVVGCYGTGVRRESD